MLPWSRKSVRRLELSKPLEISQPLRRFCETFDAHPEKSDRRFYRRTRLDYTDYSDPNVQYATETVEAIAIHIPLYKLDDFLGVVDEQRYHEMAVRDNVPAVKKAYEHYKLLLKMCGGDYNARY